MGILSCLDDETFMPKGSDKQVSGARLRQGLGGEILTPLLTPHSSLRSSTRSPRVMQESPRTRNTLLRDWSKASLSSTMPARSSIVLTGGSPRTRTPSPTISAPYCPSRPTRTSPSCSETTSIPRPSWRDLALAFAGERSAPSVRGTRSSWPSS